MSGASELVANGSFGGAAGPHRAGSPRHTAVLSDGSALQADLVVYATGYGSMNCYVAELISPEVADRLGKVWGLGSDTPKHTRFWEGELRNMWKPTQVENLWVHGGNLHQCRHYSLYLALPANQGPSCRAGNPRPWPGPQLPPELKRGCGGVMPSVQPAGASGGQLRQAMCIHPTIEG